MNGAAASGCHQDEMDRSEGHEAVCLATALSQGAPPQLAVIGIDLPHSSQ